MMGSVRYWFWRKLFKATPALWIVGGCNLWLDGIRGRWGMFVTMKFGSTDEPLKPLKTDAEHNAAVARIKALADLAPVPVDSPRTKELKQLLALVGEYEYNRFPLEFTRH